MDPSSNKQKRAHTLAHTTRVGTTITHIIYNSASLAAVSPESGRCSEPWPDRVHCLGTGGIL